MEEIEIRAWDKKGKKMYYSGDFPPQEESTSHLMYMDMEGMALLFDGRFIACDECGSFGYLSPDRYIPMLFIGLKDKNGKKIWEGDIVKKESLIGKIVYEHNAFIIIWNILITDEMTNGRVVQKNYEDISFDYIEIIGNLYENPNLLKEVK